MRTNPSRLRAAMLGASLSMVALACNEQNAITNVEGVRPTFITTRTSEEFTVGPLALNGIEQRTPDGRWQLRDVLLSGPVVGDVAGQATIALNANMDGLLGSGPAWGTMVLVTGSGETWQGSLTGHFESGLPELGIQLFSQVVLHGPGQQLLKAECDETSATSETLACEGTVTNPGD